MIDELYLTIRAGKGGDGLVSFRREKYVPKGGPNGGDGGRGGDVRLKATRDINALSKLRHTKLICAHDGQRGGSNKMHGKKGGDVVIQVPTGAVIYEVASSKQKNFLVEFNHEDEEYVAAKGGQGGLGNWHFRSPTNQAPMYAQPGKFGQQKQLYIELLLIADVGLVGFPNVGKSTFLSRVSSAKPKIADYPFTTLEPNIGVVNYKQVTFVIADIPGLIEGAHYGKGLGDQFLRHIKRTKVLIYLLDGSKGNYQVEYKALQKELRLYDSSLIRKPSIVVVNKIDLLSEIRFSHGWFGLSAATGQGIESVLDKVILLISQCRKSPPGPPRKM